MIAAPRALALLALLVLPVPAAPAAKPPWWMRDVLAPAEAPGRAGSMSRHGAARASRLLDDVRAALATSRADEPKDFSAAEALSLGNERVLAGSMHAAAAAYAAAADRDPTLGAAWSNLGSLLRHEGHWKLAGRALDHAIRLEPWNGPAWFNRAVVDERSGDMAKADAAYLRALSLAPHLWDPAANPLIVGNERAVRALHRQAMRRGTAQGILVDEGAPGRRAP